MRERGLKLSIRESWRDRQEVVPRAGTWIETESTYNIDLFSAVVPRAGTWIETRKLPCWMTQTRVVPRAGTWIETYAEVTLNTSTIPSFPVRERGLKLLLPAPGSYQPESFPVRERGLKQRDVRPDDARRRRSPCGNVD